MALTEKLTAIADAIRSQSGKAEKLTLDQMPNEITGLQSLSFEVVGNPQPENPKENTIWVDTDVEITGWAFAVEEPSNPADGMVWFSTGTASTVAFNALKENSVMVYPLSAKQYSGVAWVSRTAKSYRNGAWVDWFVWNGQLYQNGNEFTNETGGWYAANEGSLTESTIASVARNEDSMVLTVTGGRKSAMLASRNPIDLTDFDLVTFEGLLHPGTGTTDKPAYGYLYAYKDNGGTLTNAARADIKASKTAQTITLNVSGLTGEHYICPYLYTFDSTNPYLQMDSLLLS
jgi:hypothetical protein